MSKETWHGLFQWGAIAIGVGALFGIPALIAGDHGEHSLLAFFAFVVEVVVGMYWFFYFLERK